MYVLYAQLEEAMREITAGHASEYIMYGGEALATIEMIVVWLQKLGLVVRSFVCYGWR